MSKSKPELKLVEDTGSQLEAEDFGAELPPQQSEMPFAVVEGEPVTQLPRDLYIPPDALQVFLEAFEGPLDLLLYLIRKQNLDILDIPIAEITRQYMKYIEVMADLQLELAGEYLLMAAMLAEIKSRMLLPRPPSVDGQEEDDPRAELVRRLQEYERFKKAAEDLDHLSRLERDTMPASAELEERKIVTRLPDVTLKEMLDAFRDVLSRAEKFAHHHISRERLSQRERMTEILSRLQTVAFFEFTQLFRPEEGRMGVTVTFIAILELMKEGLIEIVQAEAYAPIHVRTAQRHLKVVQGGVAGVASETADAENAAALAQPELAGENDIPDDFDEPAADPAASAVEAAVADVAAAASIAVDHVESDSSVVDPALVEAAVSEAVAATESAMENIPAEEVAVAERAVGSDEALATAQAVGFDEASGAEYVAVVDEVAAESAASVDEPADQRGVLDEVVVAELSFAVAASDVVEDAVVAEFPAFETTAPQALGVTEHEDSLEAVVIEETTLEDVPLEVGLMMERETVEFVAAAEVVDVAESHTVEEHVVEEHEIEEHVVPEHVVEEHVVPEPVVEEHLAQAVTQAEPVEVTAEANEFADEQSAQVATVDVADEPAALTVTAEIADEAVASTDLPMTDVVDDHAQLSEPALEAIEVVDEQGLAELESTEQAPAVEITNVVVEDAPAPVEADAIEQDEHTDDQVTPQVSDAVSVDDDRVTGSSGEADNSDAEPSR